MKLLLDTNVVSAIMHRVPEALARLRAEEPRAVVLCSPVAAEIHYGLARLGARSRRQQLLEAEYRRLRDAVHWADWSEAAAVEFGRQKARLEQTGAIIHDMDIAIGSIALAIQARVASYNTRHLERLAGLEVADWAATSGS